MKIKILTFILSYIRKILSFRYVKFGLILIFSIFVIVLSGPFVANLIAGTMYRNSNYSGSKLIWSIGSKISLYDKYVMYYNTGNALYSQDQLQLAVDKYEEAIPIAPESKICKIKWNTVMGLVSLGKKNEVGQPTEAIGFYSRALFHLSSQTCLSQSEYAEKWNALTKELEDKIEKINKTLNNKKNNSDYKPNPDFKKPTDDDRSKARQDEIIRSQQNQKSAEADNLSNGEKNKVYEETWW